MIPNGIIFSRYNDLECEMHSKNGNLEVMIYGEANKVVKYLFDSLKMDIKINWNQSKALSFYLIMFIYCVINVIKLIQIVVHHI